jgi:hypothetical protein
MCQQPFTPRKIPGWVDHSASGKIRQIERTKLPHRESNPRPSDLLVPQSTKDRNFLCTFCSALWSHTRNLYLWQYCCSYCLNKTSTIFWDVTPCSPVLIERNLGGTNCLHLQVQKCARKPANKNETVWTAQHKFNPEDGSSIFPRIIGKTLLNYSLSFHRRQCFPLSMCALLLRWKISSTQHPNIRKDKRLW